VYAFGAAATANLTAASPLILNGQGDTNAVFVFQASSSLVTAANSVVQLENGAQACNVFWQVGSSATLESSSTFVGTIMALTSATLLSGATVQGRVLARNGAVSLDANTITAPTSCTVSSPTTTTTTTAAPTTTTTTPTGTGAAAAGGSGTGGPSAGSAGTSKGSGVAAGTGSIVTSGHSSSGEAATGTGAAAGSSGASAVVPLGFPHTGLGGAAHSRDDGLIVLGALALASSAGAVTLALRRRRLQTAVAAVDSAR
jgi:hypothetical protein